MLKGSLFTRLIPPLVAVIALLTVVVTLVGRSKMNDALTDRAMRRAVALSAGERDGILRVMRAGAHSDLDDVLEQVGRSPDIDVVRLLRPGGLVSASSRPHETGSTIADHVQQANPMGDVKPGSGGGSVRQNTVIHVVQPFRNTPECQVCHGAQDPVVAWLDLDVDVNEHSIGFATFTSLSAALGGLYLVAVIAILVPGLTTIALRPLGRVTDAMRQVRDGDLTVSVEPGGTREIDTVVSGFNRMVVDLRNAQASEEEARRNQMERVEQLAVVGELAAGLAHEVRNPLSGVKGVIDVLTRESTDDSRRRVLHDASGELVRIDQILKDLLQFAKPKPPALAPFDFNGLVRDAVALTFPGGVGHPRARCQLAEDLPPARGDAGQIRQVLVNLLLNAQQAANRAGEVIVTTGRDEGHVWCRVKDDGAGVPLDRAEAIFRPFVTSKTRGTGLGLSISRRVVELHEGRLRARQPRHAGRLVHVHAAAHAGRLRLNAVAATSILVVDDEPLQRWAVREQLQSWGYQVAEADSSAAALAAYRASAPDLVLLDLKLGAESGLDVLKALRELDPAAAVIMVTAHGGLEDAVDGFRLGLTDFFRKPLDFEALQVALRYRFDAMRLRQEVDRERLERSREAEIIGTSPAIMAALRVMHKVAASEATTVLFQGESGTGKDLFSKALHDSSGRRGGPFIAVNCAALPEPLLESELFGHERGAFTDAKSMKKGVFELADGGTLFLDEIGELKPALQAKLLRVLETMTFRRVGGLRDITVDTRVVAASNRNLEQAVQTGEFRGDLYYRLGVIQVHLPPLRDRREDLPALVEHFTTRLSVKLRKRQMTVTPAALEAFCRYDWPGNVRELRNALERAIILEDGDVITTEYLPPQLTSPAPAAAKDASPFVLPPGGTSLERMEEALVRQAIQMADGNQTRAAKLLDISRDALRYKLKKLGLIGHDAEDDEAHGHG